MTWHSGAMSSWPVIAAINNAHWCDAVCQTHGIDTQSDDHLWTSRTRTPPLYPDAVTLVPDPSVDDLFARIDSSPGCSIKDSFSSLDLTGHGFRLLFEAQWIARAPAEMQTVTTDLGWEVVNDLAGFDAWERVWRGTNGAAGVLRPTLLGRPEATFVAAKVDQRIVAGAILNRSVAAVGISNFFVEASTTAQYWRGCVELAAALFSGTWLVGYESGPLLDIALTHGFEAVGPLRVWVHDT